MVVNDPALRLAGCGNHDSVAAGMAGLEFDAEERQLTLPGTADVVVIGGGVLGTSAAFHLADAGHQNIVLIDRGPIGSGTTPFAAGQTGYLNCDKFALKFGTYCVEFFENFAERTGHAIEFHQPGSFRVALTDTYKRDLEGRHDAARQLGHPVEFLTNQQARELVPTFHPPDDCRILFIPRDGWVEPKSVAVAYAAAARDRGVMIRTGATATGLDVVDGRVRGVKTLEGTIEAGHVVLAAGAWNRQFGQRHGLNLRSVPVQHQAFVTAPIDGVIAEQPIVRVTEPQVYLRPEAGGLLCGGYGYRPLSVDMNDFPDDFEIAALKADSVYYEQLTQAASRFFPALRDAIVVQERRGLPTISPDGRLLVSECKELPGLIVASACGVGGIDRSPGVGRVVADVVSGDQSWINAEMLSADRFGDTFSNDRALRAQCEDVYAHHYHEIY
jgi:glycine/D-amino acid oxidase-like deaminating enzyme